eukprot:5303693-Pyramimonas_sp.AAC.1
MSRHGSAQPVGHSSWRGELSKVIRYLLRRLIWSWAALSAKPTASGRREDAARTWGRRFAGGA